MLLVSKAVLPLALTLLLSSPCASFVKKKEKGSVYEVPTSGKILDVRYHPEFDEWWVHCKEGESIAVYSYDEKTRQWGKILFTAKKTESPSDKLETRPASPDVSVNTKSSAPDLADSTTKVEPNKDGESDKKRKKWWDPLNIMKEITK